MPTYEETDRFITDGAYDLSVVKWEQKIVVPPHKTCQFHRNVKAQLFDAYVVVWH